MQKGSIDLARRATLMNFSLEIINLDMLFISSDKFIFLTFFSYTRIIESIDFCIQMFLFSFGENLCVSHRRPRLPAHFLVLVVEESEINHIHSQSFGRNESRLDRLIRRSGAHGRWKYAGPVRFDNDDVLLARKHHTLNPCSFCSIFALF